MSSINNDTSLIPMDEDVMKDCLVALGHTSSLAFFGHMILYGEDDTRCKYINLGNHAWGPDGIYPELKDGIPVLRITGSDGIWHYYKIRRIMWAGSDMAYITAEDEICSYIQELQMIVDFVHAVSP